MMEQTEQMPLHSSQAQTHTRINDTFLGSAERKALQWLAARMPAWIVPDTLTAIGLFASFLIFASYSLTYYSKAFLWLASFAFLLNWFGDSLDGTLARYRKIERPRYGFFIDHIIDALSEALIFLGLGLSPYLRFDFALLALISYLMMSVYVYLVTYVNGVFRISYARLGPTEVRLIAILTNTIVFFAGNLPLTLFGGTFQLTIFDMVVALIIGLLNYLFIYNTIVTAMTLSREDRIAARDRKLKIRSERKASRQALRDERLMRKTAARQMARQKVGQKRLSIALTGGQPGEGAVASKAPPAVDVKLGK